MREQSRHTCFQRLMSGGFNHDVRSRTQQLVNVVDLPRPRHVKFSATATQDDEFRIRTTRANEAHDIASNRANSQETDTPDPHGNSKNSGLDHSAGMSPSKQFLRY
jgi:hypothetical protein